MTHRPEAEAGAAAEDSPEKRYYRIGEVSRITGVKPYVLRYWESEFRFMSPQKSRSQQRLYRRRDIDMILLVKKLLYEQRFTIAGARKKLREMGVGRALETGSLSVETDHRSRYRRIREELRAIRGLLGEGAERAPEV
ncbi:MAG TPA: MerR family transcriptional regulator [Myxococcota bacterium]|nr:MerR family transcriptional regulator [Myxococcota bacterium]